ncbi:ABC-2 type transport system permease protein [Litorimonas taeanensis]|uniref:Transport permease protein n=1 Tax=Litorimonas taeanensis TaxID=568099 RepID=A0A420WLE7_9PROT|nr:ABC transporter permease [Litorimonas taeanensis]RKQ71844.1 ABC-2 type transport system permease protein [Litorimonas taeanensis]
MSDMSTLINDSTAQDGQSPSARKFGFVNWMGLWTLYKKECMRFMRIFPQTLLAPIISNLLYMTVFVLAFAALRDDPEAFIAFLAPGLIMLGILNNASANSSSSVMQGKMMGSMGDLLMTPLSYYELAIGWVGGAATRGIVVALSTALALSFFAPLMPVHIWAVLFFGVSAAFMLGMVGVLSGMWAEKFDQLAVVNQFIILPLSFLSGTFYRIEVLPTAFQKLIMFNPLFYLIDGFRYGFLGEADSNIVTGVAFISAINIVLFITVLLVLRAGWRIKS